MKIYKKLIVSSIWALLAISWQSAYCQNKITGKVLDAHSRQPLENVTVSCGLVNGGNTITDQYGNFSIVSRENIETISFSFVGYKSIILKNDTLSQDSIMESEKNLIKTSNQQTENIFDQLGSILSSIGNSIFSFLS